MEENEEKPASEAVSSGAGPVLPEMASETPIIVMHIGMGALIAAGVGCFVIGIGNLVGWW